MLLDKHNLRDGLLVLFCSACTQVHSGCEGGVAVGTMLLGRKEKLEMARLRCPGRGSALRGLSNQPWSHCRATELESERWECLLLSPQTHLELFWALPCYFCTPSPHWTAVKDCVSCSRHMAFPSICRHRAEPVAKQVASKQPPRPPSRLPHPVAAIAG